jgi:hypothetical protein
MSEWREQYDRMKRWREVLATDRGDRERVRDNFFAFAQACYHLVDWLHSDLSQPIRKPEAKSHVRASEALAFCAGICNGSKHAQLEQKDVDLSVTESTVNDYRFYPNEGRKTTTQRSCRCFISNGKAAKYWPSASLSAVLQSGRIY